MTYAVRSKGMFKFRNLLLLQTWRSAHASASRRQVETPPLAKLDILELPESKTSFQGSLKPQEQDPSALFDLVTQDITNIQEDTKRILREYIKSEELYKIATYFYTGEVRGIFMWTAPFVLLAKAINCHMHKDETLSKRQEKIIGAIELSLCSCAMRDDVGDDSAIRFNLPAAHNVWNPHQVIVASNTTHCISVNEAMKLGNDIGVGLCLAFDRAFQGQVIQNSTTVPDNDRLAHYNLVLDFKAGTPGYFMHRCLAQASGADDRLIENMAKMGFNLFMFLQVIDDSMDLRKDLAEGIPTAPVIFALEEHPVLEEMIVRRFQGEGDVEKAMELVKNSSGKEKAKKITTGFYTQTTSFLHSLLASPYRDALEILFQVQFEKKMNKFHFID